MRTPLREFDFTEDFLQHFSREQRDRHTPPPNMPSSQTHFSPRCPNTDSGYGSRLLPVTSSPVSHKRSLQPESAIFTTPFKHHLQLVYERGNRSWVLEQWTQGRKRRRKRRRRRRVPLKQSHSSTSLWVKEFTTTRKKPDG